MILKTLPPARLLKSEEVKTRSFFWGQTPVKFHRKGNIHQRLQRLKPGSVPDIQGAGGKFRNSAVIKIRAFYIVLRIFVMYFSHDIFPMRFFERSHHTSKPSFYRYRYPICVMRARLYFELRKINR